MLRTKNGTPSTTYVTLISQDGFSFIIPRSAANASGALRRMLDPRNGFSESLQGRCALETISGIVLDKVAEYFLYSWRHEGSRDVPDMEIPPELCLELVMAADYLDVLFWAGDMDAGLEYEVEGRTDGHKWRLRAGEKGSIRLDNRGYIHGVCYHSSSLLVFETHWQYICPSSRPSSTASRDTYPPHLSICVPPSSLLGLNVYRRW